MLVLTPSHLLEFVVALQSIPVDQETALAKNCLCKGKKEGQLGDTSPPDPDDCVWMPVEGREWEHAAGARWEK